MYTFSFLYKPLVYRGLGLLSQWPTHVIPVSNEESTPGAKNIYQINMY